MTWIKQKPYFTGQPNRVPLESWGKKLGTDYGQVKKEGGCLQTSGIHICKGAEGGANSASTDGGGWTAEEKMRWREQGQWLIHERSHVLNFLRSRKKRVSYSPPQSPQAKKGFALWQPWLITAQPPTFSVGDKRHSCVRSKGSAKGGGERVTAPRGV